MYRRALIEINKNNRVTSFPQGTSSFFRLMIFNQIKWAAQTLFCLQSTTVSTCTDRNSFSAKQKQRKKYIDQNNCITHANSVIFVTLKTENAKIQ